MQGASPPNVSKAWAMANIRAEANSAHHGQWARTESIKRRKAVMAMLVG